MEDTFQVVAFKQLYGMGNSSPLCCTPLAVIDPSFGFDHEVSMAFQEVGMDPSHWVKKQYQGFCWLVGFPIGSHEQQCLDLLQRIEAERYKRKGPKRKRQAMGSVKKGTRELRNLASSVSYDGRPSVC